MAYKVKVLLYINLSLLNHQINLVKNLRNTEISKDIITALSQCQGLYSEYKDRWENALAPALSYHILGKQS